VEEENLAFLLV